MKPLLNFQNLAVGFGVKPILKDLNGSLSAGQLIALMGINGVGKSCFLKTLVGLNPLISGEVFYEEKSINEYSPRELSLKVAIVLTEKFESDYMRVHELVSLGRSPHTNYWGELSPGDQKVIHEAFELLNILDLKDHFFEDLSDGQKQKVLLARALAQEPQLLILDEPTTYLDIPSKVELMEVLRKIAKEKKMAILLSTHDLNLIENIVDVIWLIEKEGSLVAKSPEDMKASGLLKSNFRI